MDFLHIHFFLFPYLIYLFFVLYTKQVLGGDTSDNCEKACFHLLAECTVCVCVCVWERERARDKVWGRKKGNEKNWSVILWLFILNNKKNNRCSAWDKAEMIALSREILFSNFRIGSVYLSPQTLCPNSHTMYVVELWSQESLKLVFQR